MNKALNTLLNKYGTETVVARTLEQLKILALSEDEEVIKAVKKLITDSGCDTEYIHSLCEYTNLVTYVSESVQVTDYPWNDEAVESEIKQ